MATKDLDKHDLAAHLGVSWRTVSAHVRKGWPHYRRGPEPAPGQRDTRRVMFTPGDVAQIEALYLHRVPAATDHQAAS